MVRFLIFKIYGQSLNGSISGVAIFDWEKLTFSLQEILVNLYEFAQ